ncbi:hypothetical protein DL93DRAFT_2103157 [Clavulina sp. PMI_390]|nr:hypothetical protein DL93DRAFT_2103157 [Clavulina sp. PMI_390]
MSVPPIHSYEHYKHLVSITPHDTPDGLVESGETVVLGFLQLGVPDSMRMLLILREEAERAQEHDVNLRFFQVDAQVQQKIAKECDVKRLPSVVAFKECKECCRVTGLNPQEIVEMIRKPYVIRLEPDVGVELKDGDGSS